MKKENEETVEDKWEPCTDLWAVLVIMISLFWGFPKDTKDHELSERVARLEGQMDMLRR